MNESQALAAEESPTTLFALGFLTLFLELVLIRYLAGSVWNLGYFPNLVLLAVFVGMGIGFVFHGVVAPRFSPLVFNLALFVLLLMVTFLRLSPPMMPGFDQWSGEVGGELYFTATPTVMSEGTSYLLFVVLFVSIATLFAGVSQRTAKAFRAFEPLRAYTLDILGSVFGILTFMLASYFQLPAFTWFLLALPAALWVVRKERLDLLRLLPLVPLAAVAVIAYTQDQKLMQNPDAPFELGVRWSPYQKVEIVNASSPRPAILVNGIGHQDMQSPETMPASFYQVPYQSRTQRGLKTKNVLVLGAGSGNDVAAALGNGVEHVDALEIDPVIADLGRRHHKLQPYADPRVALTIDDGRAFMTRATRRYDLVIYALTDSLVKVSSMAQLRLENYLFTEDSLRRAYELLSPDGEILFYNYYRRPWLIEKFQKMFHSATGRYPAKVMEAGDFMIFMAGPRFGADAVPTFVEQDVEVPTDDWPFPYLKRRQIPDFYTKALVTVGLAVALLLALLEFVNRRNPQARGSANLLTKLGFVLMGAAFLLLETKSIVQFSLLFGTTWVNSSLVFVAILLLVLAANATARLVRDQRLVWLAYGLLMVSCCLTLVFPLKELLQFESGVVRFLLASLMTFLPIFFANLIFSVSFRDQKVPEHLFGWNLLGATLGGVLEYTSMAIGYSALAVIVAVSYALVFLLFLAAGRVGAGSQVESPASAPPSAGDASA